MFIDVGDVEARVQNKNISDAQANALIADACNRAVAEITIRLNAARANEKTYMVSQGNRS